MNKKIIPFNKPIFITRPLLPNLNEFIKKINEIWVSKWLTNNGSQHALLEKKLKNYLKVQELALFNNGTTALLIAFRSLGISGEVITTPFTFAATPHVLSWNNLKPIFCDINQETMNIDANKIESLITPQTTAILPVHVFGTPCELYKIQEIADKYGLKVIYDAAHAFGVEIDDKGIGNFGDITMFSFHATKLFHTAEGGALTFKDKNLKSSIELMKNFGIKNEEKVIMLGINGKMNEIQAALGICVLDYIEKEISKRKILYETYINNLRDVEGISFFKDRKNYRSSMQYFVIRIDEKIFGKSRNVVYKEMKKYNIFTRRYFYPLCSDYPHYKYLPSSSLINLPVAHKIVEEVLSLPFYGELDIEDVEKICLILKKIKRQK